MDISINFFMKRSVRAFLICLSIISLPISASTFEDAVIAYEAQDYVMSREIFTSLAAKGDHQSQIYLAYIYEQGLGVDKNYNEAANWYLKAAARDAIAQYNLARLYLNGLGRPKNDSLAFNWYRKSANAGFAPAQNNLAYMYEKGVGTKQNYGQAVAWYKKAAAQGHGLAHISLGFLYGKGLGVQKDLNQAIKHYEQGLKSKTLEPDTIVFAEKNLVLTQNELRVFLENQQQAKEASSSQSAPSDNQSLAGISNSGELNATKPETKKEILGSPATANTNITNLGKAEVTSDNEACLINQEQVTEYKARKPSKPGNAVYIEAKSNQRICILDAEGKMTIRNLQSDKSYNFNGTAPFILMAEDWKSLSIYFQGNLIRIKTQQNDRIKLIEVDDYPSKQ
jgi:hypothetical protein